MAVLTQDLRNTVLQAAIQGKLTEQLSTDSSVDELLDKIKKEKKQLIKDKKIKKEKSLPPIENDEILFAIPDNWRWVRLGIVSNYDEKKQKINAKNAKKETWLLDLEDIKKGGQIINKKKISETKAIGDKICFSKNDILYSKLRPYLLKILVVDEDGICTPELIPFKMYGNINHHYIVNVLKSPYIDNYINSITCGIKMPRISTENMLNLTIPLPPIEEQYRIVAKIEELMTKIDEYEKIEKRLEEIKKAFPNDMKDALLQAAMQGKLTEQLPTDSSVDDLIEQIKKERKKLEDEGKIKKSKGTKSVEFEDNEEEIPFEIPTAWKWVRLGEIINFKMGKTPKRDNNNYWDGDIPWVSIADMIDGEKIISTKEQISKIAAKEVFGDISPKGTLLMSFKLTVGRVSILDCDAYHNEAIISIYPFFDNNNIMKNYLFKMLPFISNFGETKNAIKGKTLNSTSIYNLLIPLPPLEEQKRIVEILKKMLPLVENL